MSANMQQNKAWRKHMPSPPVCKRRAKNLSSREASFIRLPMSKPKHIIVGGGIIGLATGWRLLREGAEHVEIFEAKEAGRSGAAWVAAGMVSPKAEAGFEDLDIYEDGVRSLGLYPRFLEELAEDSTMPVPQLDRCGT